MPTLSFAERAQHQGVGRPYQILSRMEFEVRKQVADSLGWRLGKEGDPEFQAWKILNRDRKGLQARTHRLIQILSPFARNNDWREILVCTARRHRLPCDPGMRDVDLERTIFVHVADRMVEQMSPGEAHRIDQVVDQSAGLVHALSSMNLTPNAIRIIFKGVLSGPNPPERRFPIEDLRPSEDSRNDDSRNEDPRNHGVASWINQRLGAPFWGPSISRGIRFLKEFLAPVATAWRETLFQKPLDRINRNRQRVLSAISLIALQDLVDRNLDEFESSRL